MSDVTPGVLDGALLRLPHPVLDLSEGLLDRIEVGGVGWQEPEPCSGGLDDLADGDCLVTAEIVHDDDVAGLEYRYEQLLDIGTETLAIDRSVEDTWCGQPVAAQRAEEGQCAPVAVRGEAAQALAAGCPSAQRRHVGLDPCFIDKDQPARIETGLQGPPAPTTADNVGTGLLKGEQRFF